MDRDLTSSDSSCDLDCSRGRSVNGAWGLALEVVSTVESRISGCGTTLEDFVDIELTATGGPTTASSVLNGVDDLGVKHPESRHVGVET